MFFNRLGEVRDRSFENQQYRASGLNLVVAAITLWTTIYLERAVTSLHPDVLVMAQSGRTLVRQNPTRRDRPRGVFTSVADLARKLRKYIQSYAKSARPFRWTYTDPQLRIKVYLNE